MLFLLVLPNRISVSLAKRPCTGNAIHFGQTASPVSKHHSFPFPYPNPRHTPVDPDWWRHRPPIHHLRCRCDPIHLPLPARVCTGEQCRGRETGARADQRMPNGVRETSRCLAQPTEETLGADGDRFAHHSRTAVLPQESIVAHARASIRQRRASSQFPRFPDPRQWTESRVG